MNSGSGLKRLFSVCSEWLLVLVPTASLNKFVTKTSCPHLLLALLFDLPPHDCLPTMCTYSSSLPCASRASPLYLCVMMTRRASSQTPGSRNGSLTCKNKNLQRFVATLFRGHVESVCAELAIFILFALLTGPISPVSPLSLVSPGRSHLRIGRKN